MIIKSTPYQYFWIILLMFLPACGNLNDSSSNGTEISGAASPAPIPISTDNFLTITPSPLPTQPIIPMITPDAIQVERWREYQTELAKSFLSYLSAEEVLCEWEILGRSEQEVYVWAICKGTVGIGRLEDPAVIHLGIDGAVQNVEIPGPGTHYASDIRKMFPEDIQDRIFSDLIDYHQLSAHLEWRREHPKEPPLIVLSATSTP